MTTQERENAAFIERLTHLSDTWKYPNGDPSVSLFNQAVTRWDLTLPAGARVLELGCCETDFHEWLRRARPDVELVGVDVNPMAGYQGTFLQMPAETCAFNYGDFDAVIALGSIEHFGLGFYGDPINETADLEVVAMVERWLRPGGWFYYDVPWTPEAHYVTTNRHFRVYDDATLASRLHAGLIPTHRGFASGDRDVWTDSRPTAPMVPFWYAIELLRKGGA
jgi:SAM-dependent methyltransferase